MSTGTAPVIQLVQILMLRDPNSCAQLSPALWAAFKEVAAFYNVGRPRAAFRLVNLSAQVPEALRDEGSVIARERLTLDEIEAGWRNTRGRYSHTVDHIKVRDLARKLAEVEAPAYPIIVIDQELTPPSDWRYILVNGDKEGVVISITPTDPLYWRQRDPDRVAVIKHRVRAACTRVAGEVIGLERCDNLSCFLYSEINSVTTLDGMVLLGEEHRIRELAGRGFRARSFDPAAVQAIEETPEPLEM